MSKLFSQIIDNIKQLSHTKSLEHDFGNNVSCDCKNRIKFLIDFGVYAIQHPSDHAILIYSCRKCQFERMLNDCKSTFRI